jgi:UDP-N-acetylglucosamine---dolichyl-phosphate N-acetylglucosaminyltransferase
MKIGIIIPAYNEARTIGRVIQQVRSVPIPDAQVDIIVVDDGSTDGTGEIARSSVVSVVRHVVNCGVGGALGTGMEASLGRGADLIVTYDADEQHAASDILKLIDPIRRGAADVVIGSRLLQPGNMPFSRRWANRFANLVTFLLFRIRTTDSQSGFRAFSRSAAEKIRIRASRFEVCSEVCYEIKLHGLRLAEVPVQCIYTPYSLSKGQGIVVGLKTLGRLLLARWGGETRSSRTRDSGGS